MNTKRLMKLIEYMGSLPKAANSHFNMRGWFTHDGFDHNHDIKLGAEIKAKHLHLCGTTACALGWGCMVPSFRKAGLRLFHDSTGVGEIRFKKEIDGAAAMTFFAIDYEKMCDLFAANHDDETPKAWAKRARKLLKEWKAA